jgi:hypothetical protein
MKLKAYELLVYLMVKDEEEQKEWLRKFNEEEKVNEVQE